MHKIEINNHEIEVYDSIDELPITRFHAFNRYLLIDAGVGSDLNDFDSHIVALLRFLEKSDLESAKKEIMNMRQNIAFVFDQQSPRLNAFVPLIRSIDGKLVSDLSEQGVQSVLQLLSENNVSAGTVARWVEDAKKKLRRSLIYFSRKRKAREQKSITP